MSIFVVYHGFRACVREMESLTESQVDVALSKETYTKITVKDKLFYIVENM